MTPLNEQVWTGVQVRRSASNNMIVIEGNAEPIYLSPALAAALAVQLTIAAETPDYKATTSHFVEGKGKKSFAYTLKSLAIGDSEHDSVSEH